MGRGNGMFTKQFLKSSSQIGSFFFTGATSALFANYTIQKYLDRKKFYSNNSFQNKYSNTISAFYQYLKDQTNVYRDRVKPWKTNDQNTLDLYEKFSLPYDEPGSISPNKKVAIETLTEDIKQKASEKKYHIYVGGIPAAVTAFGNLYLNPNQNVIYCNSLEGTPISNGAARHIEPDSITEGPVALNEYRPFDYLREQMKRIVYPRLLSSTNQNDYPWKSLATSSWFFCSPSEYRQAIDVFRKNDSLAKKCINDELFKSNLKNFIKSEVQSSEIILNTIDNILQSIIGKPLFRQDIHGSLYIAKSEAEKHALNCMVSTLEQENKILKKLTNDECIERFGIKPDGDAYLKQSDRILDPHALPTLLEGIQYLGGKVYNWRLEKIWIDPSNNHQHVIEFCIPSTNERKFITAKSLDLSLGATQFEMEQTPMITATGTVILGIVHGKLPGGPIVCGGTNHITPLAKPKKINGQYYTPVKATCGASIGPVRGTQNTFLMQDAVTLLEHIQQSLNMKFDMISIRGCPRSVSATNFGEIKAFRFNSLEISNITVYQGWGGGGLTQAGRGLNHHIPSKTFSSQVKLKL